MRIALLLSGQPRFVKEVAPIILANVIGDYNVDTFCHFWFDDKLQSEPYKYGECNKGEWHKQRISADAIDEAIEAYHPVELITDGSSFSYGIFVCIIESVRHLTTQSYLKSLAYSYTFFSLLTSFKL